MHTPAHQTPCEKTRLCGWAFFLILILVPVAGVHAQTTIDNPAGADTFEELVVKIADYVRVIALPLAVIGIIITGLKFITASASGNQEGLGKARKAFWWILIGTAIVVGASTLAKAVVEFAKTLQ